MLPSSRPLRAALSVPNSEGVCRGGRGKWFSKQNIYNNKTTLRITWPLWCYLCWGGRGAEKGKWAVFNISIICTSIISHKETNKWNSYITGLYIDYRICIFEALYRQSVLLIVRHVTHRGRKCAGQLPLSQTSSHGSSAEGKETRLGVSIHAFTFGPRRIRNSSVLGFSRAHTENRNKSCLWAK